jgi:Na+-driven multidrug efflux pump
VLCLPGIWAMTQFDATKKFLSAQKLGKISVYTQIITRLVQGLFCYIFIIQFQWGIFGAALATNIVNISDMLLQDFWISLHAEGQFNQMWLPWQRTSFKGMGSFIEYCIPNALMEVFFLFSLELFVCMAGYGIIFSKG